jgi:hypothetical protein
MKKTKIILPIFLVAVMFMLSNTSVVAQYVNPTNMPRIQASGMIAFDHGGNFKLEKELLLNHVDQILAD